MASDRQTAANRLNAQKSTGPRTEQGKERVSRNPLKHGLSAVKHVVLDHEDRAAFEALLEAMIDDFAPQTALETELVTQIAALTWRMRRVPEMEMALVARLDHLQNNAPASAQGSEGDGLPWKVRWGCVSTAFLQHDFAQKLGRHEAHLVSQLARAIATLRDLQGG
jgi:hypothetical protein